MQLIPLWEADPEKAYALHNLFPAEETGFENPAYGLNFEEFLAYVEKRHRQNQGYDLPQGFVPDTVFLLEDNGSYVGIFNLRHHLNEFLENGPGHIGYGVSPAHRRKGYAAKGLALTLKEAKKLGIREAYLSVNKDNVGSLKTQLANGAHIHHQDEQKYYTRIPL